MLQSEVVKYKKNEIQVSKVKKDRAVSNRVASVVKADRDQEIFDLRLKGWTTDMIARHVGAAASSVNAVIRDEIKRINVQCLETAQEVQNIELARLDELLRAHMQYALKGDVESTSMVLRIMDQRAKYLGIYSAQKLDVKGETTKTYIGIQMDLL